MAHGKYLILSYGCQYNHKGVKIYTLSRKHDIRDRAKTGFVATSGIWPLRGGGGWTKSVKWVTNSTLRLCDPINGLVVAFDSPNVWI